MSAAIQYYDRDKKEYVTVTPDTPLPVSGAGGGTPQPGSVTTEALADGAVTDAKLAKPKVDVPNPLIPKMVIGTTLETNVLGMVGYSQTPFADSLAMYQFGGQLAVAEPQADEDATTKAYVDGQVAARIAKTAIASIDSIADPSTATIEDVANALNALLAALKG